MSEDSEHEVNVEENPYIDDFDSELQQEREELLSQASTEQTTLFYNGSASQVLAQLHIAVEQGVVDPELARDVLENAEKMNKNHEAFGDVT